MYERFWSTLEKVARILEVVRSILLALLLLRG